MKWLLSLAIVSAAHAQPVRLVQTWQNIEATRIIVGSLPEQITMATEWYWYEGQGGGGTSTSDYGDWATIDAAYEAGDTIWVNGASVYRGTIDLDRANTTVKVIPNTGRWEVTGLRTLTAGSWAVHTTVGGRTIYKQSTGEAVTAFIYDRRWADVVDADGNTQSLPIGRVPKTAQTTLVNFITDITNNDRPSWFYNSTNQLIYVYFPSNADPRSSGKTCEWCKDWNTAGFKVSANGVSVSGGYIHDFLPPAVAYPTGPDTDWLSQHSGVTDCSTYDMWYDGGFYHLAGCTGGVCTSNVFYRCKFFTVARGTDASMVEYSNSGALTGGLVKDCIIHLSDLRDYSGDPLDMYAAGPQGKAIKGIAGHAGASGSIGASGLIYDHITFIDYSDCHANGGTQACAFSGGNGSAPSDRDNASDYQIIVRDSVLQSSIFGQAQATGYIAFQRCRGNFDGTTSGGISQALFNVAASGQVLMESCTIVGEMTATTNDVVVRVSGPLTLSNTSIRANGSTDGVFFVAAGAGFLKMTHSAIDRENAGYMCKGASMSTPTVANNWYGVNISDTLFAVPAAFNSQTEWAALDTGGTFDVDFTAEWSDTATLEPAYASSIWATHDYDGNPDSPVGINKMKYAGNAGAWQFPDTGLRTRTRDWYRTRP